MDLLLQEVKNNIGEIELGDVIYSGKLDAYYIVIYNSDTKSYYLKAFKGYYTIFTYGECDSLESLRDYIVISEGLKFIHYPAKEYRLELVKKPTIGGETNVEF